MGSWRDTEERISSMGASGASTGPKSVGGSSEESSSPFEGSSVGSNGGEISTKDDRVEWKLSRLLLLLPAKDREVLDDTRIPSTSLSLSFRGRLLRSRLLPGLEDDPADESLRLEPTGRPPSSGSMSSKERL